MKFNENKSADFPEHLIQHRLDREGEQVHKQSSDIEELLAAVGNVNENLNEEQQPMQQYESSATEERIQLSRSERQRKKTKTAI